MLADVAYERGKSELAIGSLEKAAALRPRDRNVADTLERWRRESSTHGSYLERPTGHFLISTKVGTRDSDARLARPGRATGASQTHSSGGGVSRPRTARTLKGPPATSASSMKV